MPADLDAFRRAMTEAGITPPPEVVPDGRLHRFRLNGRDARRSGWYVLHADPPANGVFGSWRGGTHRWRGNGTASAVDRAEVERRARQREQEEQEARRAGAERAQRLWEAADPAEASHPYLTRKRIQPHGLRQAGDVLLVPLRGPDGGLSGLQRIWPDGTKRFTAGTHPTAAYHLIGEPGPEILIAEGIATAATLHAATGLPVAAAFSAGNLLPVTRRLRVEHPEAHLTLAADDDRGTDGNPGRTRAEEAASAVPRASVALPTFLQDEDGTDFNDLALLRGYDAVREALRVAGGSAAAPDALSHGVPETATAAEQPAGPRTPFLSLRELLQRPELLRPPEAVIPRLAWRGRTTLLAGPDKSGKSTLMAHAAARLTTGHVWLDAMLRRGRVLWCGLEEAVGDAVLRFRGLVADPDAVELYFEQPDDLLETLRARLREQPADLLLVDSLAEYARVQLGASPEEGDSSGWGRVVRPLVALGREAGCAVVLLHHVTKAGGVYRGSTEIAAAVDALWEMSLPRDGEDPTLRRFKGRARWPVEEWTVRMTDGRFALGGGGPLPLEAQILLDVAQHPGTSRNALHGRLRGRKDANLRTVTRLLTDGQLVERDRGLYIPADVTADLPTASGEEAPPW